MNKYSINYEFYFNNLDLYIPSKWLDTEEIASFEETIENCIVKFSFLNPTIQSKNDIQSLLSDNNNGTWRCKFRIIGDSPLEISDPKEILFVHNWKQLINITFESDTDEDLALCYGIINKLTSLLNNYLLIFQDKLFRCRWDIPQFSVNERTIVNKNIDNSECNYRCQFFKNGQEIKRLASDSLGFVGSVRLDKTLYNLDNHIKEAITTFKDYNHSNKYDILPLKELLLLAEYEKVHYRYKPALLIMAMSIEISVKNLIETNGSELHKFLLKNLKVQLEPLEYLEKIMPDIVKYDGDFIKYLEIDKNKFKTLFQIRNKIVHEGELYYNSNSQNKIYLDETKINDFLSFATDFIDNKVPKIIDTIKNQSTVEYFP